MFLGKRIFRTVIVTGLMLGCACKFVHDPNRSDSSLAGPRTPINPGPSRVGEVVIRYEAQGERVEKRDQLIEIAHNQIVQAEHPLVLPAVVPDAIQIAITGVSLSAWGVPIRAYGYLESDSGNMTDLKIRPVPESSGQIELSGVRSLLSDEKEQVGTVVLELAADEGGRRVIQLEVMTPPAHLVIEQVSIDEHEGRTGLIPKPIRALKSAALRLDLLQVLEIRNPADGPRLLALPLQIRGKLSTHLELRGITQGACSYTVQASGRDDILGTEFYLLRAGAERS